MENAPIKLKVMEAVQDDVNKGIVKIDSGFMRKIGANPGDIVQIKGERTTAAIVDRGYPGDFGLNIIRMDGNIRRNGRTSIGEMVDVSKAEVKVAKKISIAPASKGVLVKASPQLFKQGLLGKAVVKGDLVSLGSARKKPQPGKEVSDIFEMMESRFASFGFGDIKFVVVDTQPRKEICIVNQDTVVEFNPQAVELVEDEAIGLGINYEDIGGLSEEITKVREMVELPLKHPEVFERLGIDPPKGVLLHGAPGTGKTLLAKAVASETNANFILINGPEVISKFYGESEANLRKKFEEAEENAPSIIFFDEIDAIATKREETKGDVEKRVVAQLLGLMDGLKSRGKVIVIAATNMPNTLDAALRRPGRFDREIEIGVPDKKGRLEILKIHTRNMPLAKNVTLKEVAKVTHGFVGADLNSLAKEAAMIVLRRILPELKVLGIEEGDTIPNEILDKLMVTQKDFISALKDVRPSAMREVLVETPDVSWTDIGGLEDVKDKLKEAVEWPLKKPEVFKRMGIRPPRGILLYGPPGTGKTLLAKAVAKESEANFILVNGPSLLSKWVGESEKAVRQVFHKARQTAPTIIFFDEIDALVPRRSGASNDGRTGERLVNQMLTEMDGLESLNDVVIIAATNRPDIVDPALLRQGRFDRIILTTVPGEEGRKKIFEIYLEKMKVDYSSINHKKENYDKNGEQEEKENSSTLSKMAADMPVSEKESKALDETNSKKDINQEVNNKKSSDKKQFINKLASKTQGYVGADIQGVCREAAMLALRENISADKVTMKNFEDALEVVHPSVDKEVEDAYNKLDEYFSSARAKQIKEEKVSYFG
ncbi:CDC48 family AAA ATPase [Candidatus Woesearchaeota archaeon]|jgi:transitional endoplasmic reticulum ATPase|nr:CDC48 family AAA ATPase [Candidatus Woesearchaeota archaeon]MBT4150681.1 CDC48 family AAA ATPase [Candidatus Woesearchaeota archaeon]MBT4247899.1 CDC48 family AAA ATPase [Candidatus Woesearchaeota archaeon]MBT4434323.1 CDC48 family AAA ATPase [Candidatus Woesearchaeota archaeon]MBT7332288.1 CDC48 family AAA ATPase [Candidatus Woesearchaeota archaeon]